MRGQLFINGSWQNGEGKKFAVRDRPGNDFLWEGAEASELQLTNAVTAAAKALDTWSRDGALRKKCIDSFTALLNENNIELAKLISAETGKPLWESSQEVVAMAGKAAISKKAFDERCASKTNEIKDLRARVRFKPQGVMAVFGPFNFPGHLPNGHIIPALLAGNTVVFKPSEKTPATAEFITDLWDKAELPSGVLNLIQGGGDTGQQLVLHPDINGICFTGSAAVGASIYRAMNGDTSKILALEMGGNNPLVWRESADIESSIRIIIQSAFITSGQRCVCARRLYLPDTAASDTLTEKLSEMTARLRVGYWNETPEPFMGPLIDERSAEAVIEYQEDLIKIGARTVLKAEFKDKKNALITPGIIDASGVDLPDREVFGPLLVIQRVRDLGEAISRCNQSEYGLAASILTADENEYDEFFTRVRCGIINWNRPTTGARSDAPFGGTGCSGNHRPGAFFAADYCAYPVASLEQPVLDAKAPIPGLDA